MEGETVTKTNLSAVQQQREYENISAKKRDEQQETQKQKDKFAHTEKSDGVVEEDIEMNANFDQSKCWIP